MTDLSPHRRGPWIHFGENTYRIAFARWDGNKHIGLIQIYDQDGTPFIVESAGLAPNERRRAVVQFAIARAAIAKAEGR